MCTNIKTIILASFLSINIALGITEAIVSITGDANSLYEDCGGKIFWVLFMSYLTRVTTGVTTGVIYNVTIINPYMNELCVNKCLMFSQWIVSMINFILTLDITCSKQHDMVYFLVLIEHYMFYVYSSLIFIVFIAAMYIEIDQDLTDPAGDVLRMCCRNRHRESYQQLSSNDLIYSASLEA